MAGQRGPAGAESAPGGNWRAWGAPVGANCARPHADGSRELAGRELARGAKQRAARVNRKRPSSQTPPAASQPASREEGAPFPGRFRARVCSPFGGRNNGGPGSVCGRAEMVETVARFAISSPDDLATSWPIIWPWGRLSGLQSGPISDPKGRPPASAHWQGRRAWQDWRAW